MLVERGVREVSETRRRLGPRSAHSPARGSVSGGRGADSTDIARTSCGHRADVGHRVRHREGQLADNTDIARNTEMELGAGGACQAGGENQTAEGEENVGDREEPYTVHKISNFGQI